MSPARLDSAPMPSLLRPALQVAILCAFWGAGTLVAHAVHLPLPGSVVGMALLLAGLRVGWVRLEWLDDGAGWLLRHMLLFFVPAAVGVVDHRDLLGGAGLRAVAVVVASTALVLVATGLTVEWLARRRDAAGAEVRP